MAGMAGICELTAVVRVQVRMTTMKPREDGRERTSLG